jgi:hypothetical protein
VKSRNVRNIEKQFTVLFGIDRLYEKLYNKNFKKQCRGKPTKRYLKLLKQVETYEKNSDALLRQYRDSII